MDRLFRLDVGVRTHDPLQATPRWPRRPRWCAGRGEPRWGPLVGSTGNRIAGTIVGLLFGGFASANVGWWRASLELSGVQRLACILS